MGKYQTYLEYEATNTDWLGRAPKHWNSIPVGRLFKRIKRTGNIEKELLSVYRDYGVIPKSSRDDNNNKPSEDLSPYQLVEPNDLVMNKMKTWQGSIAISEYEGIVSPAYFVYKPLPEMFNVAHPKYVHYLLRNPMYIAQYLRRSKGIRVNQWDLDPDEFQRVELLLPSKDEQLKIFSFLDHETVKIDTLIEKQQQLIKLLKEKRQAVISHAVTKGLNPNAPMKDSGVEWLGEVPEGWVKSYLGFECSVKARLGWKGLKADEYVDEGFIFLATPNIKGNEIDFENVNYITEERYEESPEIMLEVGDVLVTKDGSTTGTTNLVRMLPAPTTVNSSIAVIRTMGRLDSTYLYYFFVSTYIQNIINRMRGGMGVPHLFQADLKKFAVLMPPTREQVDIASHIEECLPKFDLLIEKANKEVSLLQERRTALISAAVTGKIDVRDWSQ